MVITDRDKIVDFLSGNTSDYRQRSYNDIIGCDDDKMEACHDQVQWMFPLHEESKFAETYPVITPSVAEEAKQNPQVISNLKQAADRMARFYGIGNYDDRNKQRVWCKPNNHNLLRITRIIRSLRMFGLEKEAKDFYTNAIVAAVRFLNADDLTFKYWEKALTGGIWETLR